MSSSALEAGDAVGWNVRLGRVGVALDAFLLDKEMVYMRSAILRWAWIYREWYFPNRNQRWFMNGDASRTMDYLSECGERSADGPGLANCGIFRTELGFGRAWVCCVAFTEPILA